MKKILVPCDFSPNSIEAFRFALSLASANKGSVHVLHAIEFPVNLIASFDVQIQSYDAAMVKEFDKIAISNYNKIKSRYSKKTDKVSFSITHGLVVPVIRQHIVAKKFDLVVMGTKGASGLKEFFIGSNTEKIVRTSPVPVLTVRKAARMSSIKNIILPTNLDSKQSGFIKKTKDLQSFFKAKLHVLMVNTPEVFRSDFEMRSALEKFAKQNSLKNYTLNIRSDITESEGIGNFAKEISGGMIAMATHGRKGLAHLFSGSIAEEVVNHYNYLIWTYCSK